MDIVVYQEDNGNVSILERENRWNSFRKYIKGKFPHNLYIFLSAFIFIYSFSFVEPVWPVVFLFLFGFIYFIIVEIFGIRRFIISDKPEYMSISHSDIILSYGEVYPNLKCFIIIKDKCNILVFTSAFDIEKGLYISDKTQSFDDGISKNLYTTEYFGDTFVNDVKSIIGNIKNNNDFFEYGKIKNYYLEDFIYIYNKYVKNI
jgi:hypothetical protein